MSKVRLIRRTLGTAVAAALVAGTASLAPATAHAQARAVTPTSDTMVAVGSGKLVRLPGTMSDLFVADPGIADVQVRSANQIYIFGKKSGETSVYATNEAGKVIYSTNVRVGNNIDSIGDLLGTAMPDAKIQATPMNGVVLLTGTVGAPEDVEEASRIVQAYVGQETQIISRLKTATPLQVMLRVRFAEVSRSLAKDIGFNMLTRDQSGGFLFGLFKGAPGTIEDITGGITDPNTGLPAVIGTEYTFDTNPAKYTIGAAGRLFGMDVLSALELAENNGLATILAEPTLTALSGETASFLAGGEFPIPVSQSLGAISVEYKQYGVGLAFTPTVLADGRISMRVRPEVSELSDQGSIRLNNFSVPALTTRRTETTVELGSGQSFMIGGLLRNTSNNAVDKAPWLGDLPILGALFRSNSFRRQQTELVIIVTPYLVKPVSDSQIALPTDGYRIPNDAQRVLMDRSQDSRPAPRPGPVTAPSQAPSAVLGAASPSIAPAAAASAQSTAAAPAASSSASPGFAF